MKTNEEIIEEFKKEFKYRYNLSPDRTIESHPIQVENNIVQLYSFEKQAILKALEAKDAEHKEEMIDLVRSSPISLKYAERLQWKKEKLNQLKSNE